MVFARRTYRRYVLADSRFAVLYYDNRHTAWHTVLQVCGAVVFPVRKGYTVQQRHSKCSYKYIVAVDIRL